MKRFTIEEFNEKRNFLKELFYKTKEFFVFENNLSQVLISAPHAIGQLRLGRPKGAEPNTASLAAILHLQTKCNAIIKVANEHNDANFDEFSPYKKQMENIVKKKHIKFVLDLHTLASHRKEIVNIGIHHGRLVQTSEKEKHLEKLLECFKNNGFCVSIDSPFSAGPQTLTYHFGKCSDVFTVQVEVNYKIFSSKTEDKMNAFINSLQQFVEYAESIKA